MKCPFCKEFKGNSKVRGYPVKEQLHVHLMTKHAEKFRDIEYRKRFEVSSNNIKEVDDMKVLETIKLHNVEGIAGHSGTDEYGNNWIEFEVDYFAEQIDGECSICGKVISQGWMCLDGGDEVCAEHIKI